MSAELTQVAAAVVTALNAGSWSMSFTAVRQHVVSPKLEDLGTMLVAVVPISSDIEQFTRGSVVKVIAADVGVMARVSAIDTATIDPYVDLVDEIVDAFHGKRLTGLPAAMCTASRPEPIYDALRLEQERLFFSIINLEFRHYP